MRRSRIKKGVENVVAVFRVPLDHIRREEDGVPINESFPDDQLFSLEVIEEIEELCSLDQSESPWYAEFVNYLVCGEIPTNLSFHQRRKFLHDVRHYYWNESYLFKKGSDLMFRRCIPLEEVESVIRHCHSLPVGGHAKAFRTSAKILQSGLY